MNATEELLNEVQELTWAMIDDQASETEVSRLEDLLLENDEARQTYVLCMQMHADLHYMFGGKPRMPEALQKLLDAEKAKSKRTPLPIVNLPVSSAVISHANGSM